MHWVTYYVRRALGNMKRELVLSSATILTLAFSFLCFCAILALALGLGRLAQSWSEDFHISLYLQQEVSPEEAARIAAAIEQLPQVAQASIVPPAEMRDRLAADIGGETDLGTLEQRLFPTALEVRLSEHVNDAAVLGPLAARFGQLSAVERVETYGDLFERLTLVLNVARGVSVILGIIVLLTTLLVVSNTVRLSLLGRRKEVEIMKLCGATDGFVRTPFVLSGAFQGLVGAVLALLALTVAGTALDHLVGGFLPVLAAQGPAGLPVVGWVAVTIGGTILGLVGSHMSVTRFLRSAP